MKERFVNGYRLIFIPEYKNTYIKDNWNGWIFEHRYIMEIHLGRKLKRQEIIHHIDGNKLNNNISNLKLTTQNNHMKIHNPKKITYCIDCGVELSYYKHNRCMKCYRLSQRKVVWPTKEQLKEDIDTLSFVAIGKKYGVSDNAVRKWAKKYNLL